MPANLPTMGRSASTAWLVTPISRVGGFSFFVFLNPWASTMKFCFSFAWVQTFYLNLVWRAVGCFAPSPPPPRRDCAKEMTLSLKKRNFVSHLGILTMDSRIVHCLVIMMVVMLDHLADGITCCNNFAQIVQR